MEAFCAGTATFGKGNRWMEWLFRERHIPMTNPFYNLQAVFLATRAGLFRHLRLLLPPLCLKVFPPFLFFSGDSLFFLCVRHPSDEGGNDDPLVELERNYDEWILRHPVQVVLLDLTDEKVN